MLSPNVSVAIMPRCALPFHHATLCQSTCFFTLLGSVLLHEVHCCGHDQVHLRRLPHQERRIGRGALRVLAGTDFGRCVHVACRTSRQSLSLKKTACSRSTCRQKVCPPEPQQAAQKLRLCSACKHCLHCMTEYAVGIYTFMWHCRQAIRQHSRFPQAGGRIPDDLPGVPQPEHREGSVCPVCYVFVGFRTLQPETCSAGATTLSCMQDQCARDADVPCTFDRAVDIMEEPVDEDGVSHEGDGKQSQRKRKGNKRKR